MINSLLAGEQHHGGDHPTIVMQSVDLVGVDRELKRQ